MLPVIFGTDQSHRTPRFAYIQPISQQAAAATRPYRGLILDTRAPAVVCPRRGSRTMQIIESIKQQQVNSQLSVQQLQFVFFWDNVNILKNV